MPDAIEHRDYSFSAPTLISVFSDRMEFVSYGGLAGDVQMEDILNGISVCRNRKLAGIFYRLQLVEAYGTGLPKIRGAYTGKSVQPEFHAGSMSFRVVLPNMNQAVAPSKTKNSAHTEDTEQILHYIEENGAVSRSDIEEHFSLSASTAIRLMKKLKESGQIAVIGKGKNTRYAIVSEEKNIMCDI